MRKAATKATSGEQTFRGHGTRLRGGFAAWLPGNEHDRDGSCHYPRDIPFRGDFPGLAKGEIQPFFKTSEQACRGAEVR